LEVKQTTWCSWSTTTASCARVAVLHATHKTFFNSQAHAEQKKRGAGRFVLDREALEHSQTKNSPVSVFGAPAGCWWPMYLSSHTKQPRNRLRSASRLLEVKQTTWYSWSTTTASCARVAVLHATHKTFFNSQARMPNKKNKEPDVLFWTGKHLNTAKQKTAP
jgi:hypothetical protein